MNIKLLEEKVELPEGVQAQLEGSIITLKGKKGELKKNFTYPTISPTLDGDIISFKAKNATKREKRMIGTFMSHIKNMIKGVTEGHLYKMKICSGHFPMKVNVKGTDFVVENFLGEKIPRIIKIKDGVSVKIDGNDVIIESTDKELAGQCAASIEVLTVIKGRDKRIFQDGIYITEKSGKEL